MQGLAVVFSWPIDLCVQLLLEAAREAGRTKDGQIAELKGVVKAQNETMEEMTVKMREHEATRRKLHNTIQELKVGQVVIVVNAVINYNNSNKPLLPYSTCKNYMINWNVVWRWLT